MELRTKEFRAKAQRTANTTHCCSFCFVSVSVTFLSIFRSRIVCRALSFRLVVVLLRLRIAYLLIDISFSYRLSCFLYVACRCFALSPYRLPYYRYLVLVSFVVLHLCRLVVVLLCLRIAYLLIGISFSYRLSCFLYVASSLFCFVSVPLTLTIFRSRIVCCASAIVWDPRLKGIALELCRSKLGSGNNPLGN